MVAIAGPVSTIAGGLTLGVVFRDMMAQVKEAEEKAIAGADLTQVAVAGKLSLLIQQAQTTYAASLSKTMSELTSKDQEIINSINSTLQQFTSHAFSDVLALEKQATAAIHDLPFSGSFPQLLEFTPRYVVPASAPGSNVTLSFQGDFYDLPRPEFVPIATIGGKSFSSVSKSSDSFSFELPLSVLSFGNQAIKSNYLNIDVPYQSAVVRFSNVWRVSIIAVAAVILVGITVVIVWTRAWLWLVLPVILLITGIVVDKRMVGKQESAMSHTAFILPIYTIPTTPGRITVVITTPTTSVEQKEVVSDVQIQDSGPGRY